MCIFFDGVVFRAESDEYVEIANFGDAEQDLAGWRLADRDNPAQTFVFPAWIIEPGNVVRVYTDEVHPEWGGFSFGRGTAIWNNGDPDTAELDDQYGDLVSSKSYPPGCD